MAALNAKQNYTMATLDEFFGEVTSVVSVEEFFKTLDTESHKRSEMVYKSVHKYLGNTKKEPDKYLKLRNTMI